MKYQFYLWSLLLFSLIIQAQIQPNKNAKYSFHVQGNCEMCKKRIEKAALNVLGVKSANWHLDSGALYIILNEKKTHIDSVHISVANVGHDTEGMKASDEAYARLHSCCRYTR